MNMVVNSALFVLMSVVGPFWHRYDVGECGGLCKLDGPLHVGGQRA